MFNFYRKKPPVAEQTKIWRTGMWVVLDGKTGILNRLNPVEVHLVDADGFTIDVVNCELNALRQARWIEIPGPRRPTQEKGVELGYGA